MNNQFVSLIELNLDGCEFQDSSSLALQHGQVSPSRISSPHFGQSIVAAKLVAIPGQGSIVEQLLNYSIGQGYLVQRT
jgi:hypothetical protein